VSVINVTSPSSFRRVSGTAIGGATYYGLCKLLCRMNTFDEAMDLAELGDSRDVNLTVQDIYGGSYEQAGLSGEITAAFFGKCASAIGPVRTARSRKRAYVSVLEKIGLVLVALLSANLLASSHVVRMLAADGDWQALGVPVILREVVLLLMPAVVAYLVFWSSEARLSSSHPPLHAESNTSAKVNSPPGMPHLRNKNASAGSGAASVSFEEADIARALVVMVAQNVTQIAYLNALLHKSKRVLFTGNFLRHNRIALRALSSMMHNWSKGEIQALFMEHEGYFGAIGTFLYSCGAQDQDMHGQGHILQRQDSSQGLGSVDEEVVSVTSSSSDENINVIEDLLFKGEFPRRRSAAPIRMS